MNLLKSLHNPQAWSIHWAEVKLWTSVDDITRRLHISTLIYIYKYKNYSINNIICIFLPFQFIQISNSVDKKKSKEKKLFWIWEVMGNLITSKSGTAPNNWCRKKSSSWLVTLLTRVFNSNLYVITPALGSNTTLAINHPMPFSHIYLSLAHDFNLILFTFNTFFNFNMWDQTMHFGPIKGEVRKVLC